MTNLPPVQELSDEKLAEMLAAAETATPGERRLTKFNGIPNAVMVPHPDFGGMAICTLAVHHDIHGNAEFFRLTDPATIIALVTELQHSRNDNPLISYEGARFTDEAGTPLVVIRAGQHSRAAEAVAWQWRIDAERWRALMSSARMHFMGSAGFVHTPKDGNPENRALSNQTPSPRGECDLHFGMEFWNEGGRDERFPDTFERELMSVYVDAIRAARLGVSADDLSKEDAFNAAGGASPASPSPATGVREWPGENYELYERVHNAAIAAYEKSTPSLTYSASALRHAVDAAILSALVEQP